MPSLGKLYNVPYMRQTKTILSVCALADLELEIPEYKHFEDNKKPEFLAKFPHGKIPAFEGSNGLNLTEGAAIARYLASLAPNSGLLGSTLEDAALVDQWVNFGQTEIASNIDFIYGMLRGFAPYTKALHTSLTERLVRSLFTLETHLSTRTFFVGERITLADITVASCLYRVFAVSADAPMRAKLINTLRFLETIVHQPKIESILGPVEYIEKALQYVPPKKEKAPAPPKKETPKKVEQVDEVEEEEEDLGPEPPKGFNLEDWKRAYSNKDTRGPNGALEWFYDKFDRENFTIWRVDFKYNEDLTEIFKSSNQIGGFYTRLDESRKYLFGSMGVLGELNASVISGVLIVHGQNAVDVVKCAPDYESYEYQKLEIFESQDDKAFFEGALAWDLVIDGKEWKDGKSFK